MQHPASSDPTVSHMPKDFASLSTFSCPFHPDCPARRTHRSLLRYFTNKTNKMWLESWDKKTKEFEAFYSVSSPSSDTLLFE
jgi:hypothetical protein